MAVPPSSPANVASSQRKKTKKIDRSETRNEEGPTKSKRTKSPGVRVIGGRIYDSENGKTCHQCRQKTMDFTAGCKNMKLGKQCTIKFCHKCLLNRYGEKAEEMEARDDWMCPKCKGICNCSFCMKKRGHKPTGNLVQTVKATGFSSVSELLDVKGPDVCQVMTVKKKLEVSTEVPVVASPKKQGKENLLNGSCNTKVISPTPPSSPNEKMNKKLKRERLQEKADSVKGSDISSSPKKETNCTIRKSPRKKGIPEEVPNKEEKMKTNDCKVPATNVKEVLNKGKKPKVQAEPKLKPHTINKDTGLNEKKVEVTLPTGTLLSTVVGIDLLPEDIGHALQFMEFCSTFEKVLDIRKGQAESVLRAIMCGRNTRRGKSSSATHFITQLVSFILKHREEESPPSSPTNDSDSWIHSLKRCLSESDLELEDIPESCFDNGSHGYEMLEPSQKLRLLTFLCDEALYTKEIRNWVEEQNVKFVEKVKEAKEGLNVAKEKERLIKRKLQDEIAQIVMEKNGGPLTISEHASIVSSIKGEAEQARAEMLEAMDLVHKKKRRSDDVRTEMVFMDDKGHAYWRLNCFSDLLSQDIGHPEQISSKDKWFTFSEDEATMIEKHISSQRVVSEQSNYKLKRKASEDHVDKTMFTNSCDTH